MKILIFIFSILVIGVSISYAEQITPTNTTLTDMFRTEVANPEKNDLQLSQRAVLEATLFAEKIEAVQQIDSKNTTDTQSEIIRAEMEAQFYKTFDLIRTLESDDEYAEASVARAIIQTAVDYYMNSDSRLSKDIREDLSKYSEEMTQSLITAATQNN